MIKNKEIQFLIKVVRNGAILAGLYFFSVWATTQQLVFITHIKPVLVFLGTYTLTECAKRYKLDYKNPKKRNKLNTMVFY